MLLLIRVYLLYLNIAEKTTFAIIKVPFINVKDQLSEFYHFLFWMSHREPFTTEIKQDYSNFSK